MTPAPTKPIPVRIPCKNLLTAFGSIDFESPGKPSETIVATAAPRLTKAWVGKPAGLPCSSRFKPRALPSIRAAPSRTAISQFPLNTTQCIDHGHRAEGKLLLNRSKPPNYMPPVFWGPPLNKSCERRLGILAKNGRADAFLS